MKFFDEAGFADSRLTDDQRQLPVALPRSLPAAQQHGDLLIATD
jgi:hypothetical protein